MDMSGDQTQDRSSSRWKWKDRNGSRVSRVKIVNFVTTSFCSILAGLTALILGFMIKADQNGCEDQTIYQDEIKCLKDLKNNITRCRPKCVGEKFSLFGMDGCHPWLDCNSIMDEIHVTDHILGGGAVKMVKLGTWKGYNVAVSFLRDNSFVEDFLFNIQMLKMFNTETDNISDHVVQLIGLCQDSQYIVVTEYHSLGSAERVKNILQKDLPLYNSFTTLFSVSLDFVRTLVMLHNHDKGKRVFCDANDPEKALSQFLLSSDLRLLLNDMDALPVVNEADGIFVKCGHRELYGDFVAPEQMWPYEDLPFNDSMMPGYTEKVDVWKIPDIFNYLMRDVAGSNKLRLRLFNIHAKCKNVPDLRPSSSKVLEEYEKAFKILGGNDDEQRIIKAL